MPIFYENIYQRTLVQDGIKLINLRNNANWRNILKTLLGHRKDEVHFLLDNDSQKEIGYNKAVINSESMKHFELNIEQITFVGENEFEDAFDNEVLITTLKNAFAEVNDDKWELLNIDELRQKRKFSSEFISRTKEITEDYRYSKPKFAEAVAKECSKNQIPREIINAFDKIRSQIGISEIN